MESGDWVLRGALVRAVLVLAAFVGFALLTTPTYRVTTSLVVGHRLVEGTVLDRDLERARSASEEMARRRANRSTVASVPSSAPSGAPEASTDPLDAAVAFVVGNRPAPTVPPDVKQKRETERVRLEVERSRLRADLAKVEAASADDSDNPYDLPSNGPDPRLLRRRLVEIDALLVSLERNTAPVEDRSFFAALGELLAKIPAASPSASASAPPAAAPVTKANVATALVDPDRTLLFLIGIVAAGLAAAVPVAFRSPVPSAPGPREPSSVEAPPATMERAAPPPAAPAEPDPAPDESRVMAYPVAWSGHAARGDAHADVAKALRSLSEEDCFVLGVASDGDARSSARVVAEIAAAIDADDLRVLLLEAGLGDPLLHKALGVELIADADFSTQLSRRVSGEGDADPWFVLGCGPSLHVLSAEKPARELLLSRPFETCVSELRLFYDVIVIHAPPMTDAVACRAVDDVIDGVVLVSRSGTLRENASPFSEKTFEKVMTEN